MMLDPWLDDSPHDECGVFGIYAPEMDVARLTFFALFALQHRGQESAGIAVTDGSRLIVHKDMGLVSQVFSEQTLQTLPGKLAIGHVRYSTTGANEIRNAQPFARTRNGSFIALAHNGNLVNTDELREDLLRSGHIFESTSDTEVIAALLAEHPSRDMKEALRDIIPRLRGAFSAVLLTKDEIIGFRDPYGVRPLVLGELDGRYCLSSESSGLDIIGAKLLREIEPGEICCIDEDGYHIEQVINRERESLCIFEFIYFARPDSLMKGQTLYTARSRMGEELAIESPVHADLVIPVPDTGQFGRHRLRGRQRDHLRRGPHQEPIHRPDVHRPRRPGPQAGHPHEVQSPGDGHPREASGSGGRLHRAGQHHPCSGARAVRSRGA